MVREINEIIVHCSATKASQDFTVDDVRRWHVDGNNWSDIGYHYVIRRSGLVEDGRSLDAPGAHAKGRNKSSIGICLIGGLDDNGKPFANFSINQYRSLELLIKSLKGRFGITEIIGHRDVPGSGKECPCFDVKSFMGG